MTLTILICVHSTNEFHDMLLNKSILSLVNQTYKNFKTIIVLDECWSKTKEMIESSNYDLDLTILTRNKKEGLSYAKNFGLQYVETEWVGFLDADDLYLPTKLEQQVNYIKNNEVDFLGTHCWNINGDDDENLFPSCFNDKNNITHLEISNKIFRNKFLSKYSLTKGFIMNSSEFADVKSWGLTFSILTPTENENKYSFTYDVLERIKDLEKNNDSYVIIKTGEKMIYATSITPSNIGFFIAKLGE
jgi:glycosyltransferase involved in cell wall biosynthesis